MHTYLAYNSEVKLYNVKIIFFKEDLFIFYADECLPASMYVHCMHAVLMETRGDCQVPLELEF